VTAFTADNQMVQFNTLDFTMTDMDELFIYRPPMMPTYSIGKSNQDILLLTGDGIIVSQYVSLSKFSGIIDVPLAITTVNNKMITFDPRHNEGLPSGVWYDKGQGKFYWHYSKTFSMIYAPYSDDQSGGGGFNPGNYTGRSAIAGGVNIGNETMVMLMKEDATSNYEICVFSKDTDPPGAKALITIPTAGKTLLDGALGYEFDRTSQVLYVVRNEGIYAITYGANPANVPAGAKFSAPAGETMVLAKVFEEGNYVSGDPYFSPLPLHHTSLIVATSTSGGAAGGKVYILPMVNPGTGNLDVANAIVYDGFGQILDVINLGY
jgi:hypothetical protein